MNAHLLQSLYDSGIEPPFGCRMFHEHGGCFFRRDCRDFSSGYCCGQHHSTTHLRLPCSHSAPFSEASRIAAAAYLLLLSLLQYSPALPCPLVALWRSLALLCCLICQHLFSSFCGYPRLLCARQMTLVAVQKLAHGGREATLDVHCRHCRLWGSRPLLGCTALPRTSQSPTVATGACFPAPTEDNKITLA